MEQEQTTAELTGGDLQGMGGDSRGAELTSRDCAHDVERLVRIGWGPGMRTAWECTACGRREDVHHGQV